MKSLTLLLVSAAMFSPLFCLATETKAPQPKTAILTTTLEELGYPSGFSFDDTTVPNVRSLLFHLPKNMRVQSATLHIVYRTSLPHDGRASLQVAFNDAPAEEIFLMADNLTHEWLIPVPSEDLNGGQLKVAVRGNIATSYTHCSDGQPQGGVVHIGADSSLVSIQEGVPLSLNDAWLTLPDEVVVSIPNRALDDTSFKAILDWVTLLQRHHHTVHITTLPDLGNLVIAPAIDIRASMARTSDTITEQHSLWSNPANNIGVISFDGGSFIAVTHPYPGVQHFAQHWNTLTAPIHIDPDALVHIAENRKSVALDTLGLSTVPSMLGHKLQWNVTLTPWNIPPGMVPTTATLHITLPHTSPEMVFRVFVYLNDVLVQSQRLTNNVTRQQVALSFEDVPRSVAYQLRIVIRDSGKDDCNIPKVTFPISIGKQSVVTFEKPNSVVTGFSSMPTALGHGFDLYLPKSYLDDSAHYLPLLGQLLNGFAVTPDNYELVIFDPAQPPTPKRNFILIGDMPPGGPIAELRFDQGRVQLVNNKNDVLISERTLRESSVVQLLRYGNAAGLWLYPGQADTLPSINAMHLGGDDVAIYAPENLLLSIDSHQNDLAQMQYLELPRWYERLHQQRFIWLFVGWVLLTLGIVYLYIKSKQHRRA